MAGRKRKEPDVGPEPGVNPYQRGAIVRIKFTNFVTYSDIEFRPGPNLNVVIGPNGTGKSTIVCGICLGLCGSPTLLGRQKKVGDFVKGGEDAAKIEIELFQAGGNVIVGRDIQKNSTSTWTLNGKKALEKEVKEVVASFNIQLDN